MLSVYRLKGYPLAENMTSLNFKHFCISILYFYVLGPVGGGNAPASFNDHQQTKKGALTKSETRRSDLCEPADTLT